MTRETLERRLHFLQDEVLSLGSMAEQSITDSVKALRNRDIAAAKKVYKRDEKINERRFAIEDACLTLIATQQPMARDLRILAAVLEVITELERIGDYGKGIARIVTMLGPEPLSPEILDNFDAMVTVATGMLRRALASFVAGDEKTARSVPPSDDEVDRRYNLVYRELVRQMAVNPDSIDHATHLLWVAHNLERFADRVSNICERTIFTATGEILEIQSTDDEKGPLPA